MLDRMLTRLRRRLCGKVKLQLFLEGGGETLVAWHLKEPSAYRERLLQSMKHHLGRLSLGGPVSGLRLELGDLRGEVGKQEGLLLRKGKQPEAVRLALAQLRERFGRDPVQRVVEVEPSSLLPERRFALTELDPG